MNEDGWKLYFKFLLFWFSALDMHLKFMLTFLKAVGMIENQT